MASSMTTPAWSPPAAQRERLRQTVLRARNVRVVGSERLAHELHGPTQRPLRVLEPVHRLIVVAEVAVPDRDHRVLRPEVRFCDLQPLFVVGKRGLGPLGGEDCGALRREELREGLGIVVGDRSQQSIGPLQLVQSLFPLPASL